MQDIKGSAKFKGKALQNEDKLEKMFENLRNTGEDHWSASSGVAPSQGNHSARVLPWSMVKTKMMMKMTIIVMRR